MKNKVVIITGASSGIGLACAKEFAGKQMKIVLAARSIDKLNEISKEFHNNGIECLAVKTDISIEDDCKHLVNETIKKFGRIDYLINNAGISMRAMFADLNLDVIEKVMNTNFWGTVYCTKHALPHLIASKGSVVGISSITGFVGLPGRTGYAASKFAMNGFLETLRMEHLKTGLHVMIVAPGFTNTNIRKTALTKNGCSQGKTPRKEEKMMSPDKVARKILKGIKNKRRTIILTGQGQLIVNLYKFFPNLMDKLVYWHMAKEPDSPFK